MPIPPPSTELHHKHKPLTRLTQLFEIDDAVDAIPVHMATAGIILAVAGTIAERAEQGVYFLYTVFICGFVYPIISRDIQLSGLVGISSG